MLPQDQSVQHVSMNMFAQPFPHSTGSTDNKPGSGCDMHTHPKRGTHTKTPPEAASMEKTYGVQLCRGTPGQGAYPTAVHSSESKARDKAQQAELRGRAIQIRGGRDL